MGSGSGAGLPVLGKQTKKKLPGCGSGLCRAPADEQLLLFIGQPTTVGHQPPSVER